MLAVRIAHSDPTKVIERQTHFEEHKRYLRAAPLRILLSGPVAAGDRDTARCPDRGRGREPCGAGGLQCRRSLRDARRLRGGSDTEVEFSLSRLHEIVLPA